MTMTSDDPLGHICRNEFRDELGEPLSYYKARELVEEAFAVRRELELELARWRRSDEHMQIMVEDLTGALNDVLYRALKGVDSSQWDSLPPINAEEGAS